MDITNIIKSLGVKSPKPEKNNRTKKSSKMVINRKTPNEYFFIILLYHHFPFQNYSPISAGGGQAHKLEIEGHSHILENVGMSGLEFEDEVTEDFAVGRDGMLHLPPLI